MGSIYSGYSKFANEVGTAPVPFIVAGKDLAWLTGFHKSLVVMVQVCPLTQPAPLRLLLCIMPVDRFTQVTAKLPL